ncbi:hypothetical protein L5515_005921 [Caenorhabditis briggsae]|uniref:Uncharacterized protein n=2 Tax=Caenorhabditis briggsae TaxID=6238 RepID=A0AAE9F1A5_CAEBR|nr:hypothetical protein L5515_005921 [Caenorhabditis briggsae]
MSGAGPSNEVEMNVLQPKTDPPAGRRESRISINSDLDEEQRQAYLTEHVPEEYKRDPNQRREDSDNEELSCCSKCCVDLCMSICMPICMCKCYKWGDATKPQIKERNPHTGLEITPEQLAALKAAKLQKAAAGNEVAQTDPGASTSIVTEDPNAQDSTTQHSTVSEGTPRHSQTDQQATRESGESSQASPGTREELSTRNLESPSDYNKPSSFTQGNDPASTEVTIRKPNRQAAIIYRRIHLSAPIPTTTKASDTEKTPMPKKEAPTETPIMGQPGTSRESEGSDEVKLHLQKKSNKKGQSKVVFKKYRPT